MRQKRYFICLLPALLLAAALCLPARAFSKEPSSWAAEQCKHLEDVGLLDWQLYTGSTDPASAINRGAFCQMLVSLVQMEGDWEKIGMVEPVPSDYFADTDADFGFAMYYGASIGITEGTIKMDKDDFQTALTMMYECFGWDPKLGCPTAECLDYYEMGDVKENLAALGLLPDAK